MNEKSTDNICLECKGITENDYRACKGACSQEMHYGGDGYLDTKGLISCNCCEECRWKCHDSFLQSVEDGEQ